MKQFLCILAFCGFILFSGQAFALTSGGVTAGTISTPNGSSNESFTGNAGEGVILSVSAGYNAYIYVYKPDMTLWSVQYNRFTGTLPSTGTYSVVITATGGGSGAYDAYYVNGTGGVSGGTMTSGQSYNSTLAANGITSYQVSATSGEVLLFNTVASYSAYIYVFKPDGSQLYAAGSNRFNYAAPSTGTYTIAVVGVSTASSGDVDLYYVNGAGGVSGDVSDDEINGGAANNSTLAANGITSYSFEGTSGQYVLLNASASYAGYIYVFEPDGSALGGPGYDRFAYTLPSTGTYTVAVMGVSTASSGDMDMYYAKGAGTSLRGGLITTETRAGTLPKNGLESYKFTGVASNSLTIASTGGFTRYIVVLRPDGSYWGANYNSFSNTLPSTGEYTVVLYSTSSASTGDYSITMTTPPDTVAATDATRVGQSTMACTAVQNAGNPPNPRTMSTGSAVTKMAGNPIEFDVGFKQQVETDYSAGGLTFTRIYRSDSTWTDNTVGDLWRHNYARTLNVSGSAADITDGTGATTHYTLSGSDWIPDDPDTTATLEDVSGDYVYTLPDNTVEKYDGTTKLLERIEYRGGGALTLGYNGSNELTSVTNENGRQLTMTYSSGRLATLVTPDGTFSYAYDGNDNLSTVTRPDTEVRTYHYENGSYVNALTGITDEKGVRFATFAYDGSGRAITTKHAGDVDEFGVDYHSGQTSTITNPLGKDTTYYYTNINDVRKVIQVDGEASTNCVASNRYYNYDTKGRIIGKTDWDNNVTWFSYDDRDNVTKITEAAGTADQRVTTITYNNDFNLPDLVTETGKTTDYDYDTYGRLTSVTVTDTNTSETRITTYTYHSNGTDGSGNTILGRLDTVNGPRTDVTDTTEYDYDGNYNLTTITNALGQVYEITARDSAGRPTTVEDVNDVETDFAYDSNGWLESATRAPGTALEAETTFDYDENGNLTLLTLANGATLEYSYDNAQRLTGVEDALGNTITYTLDDAGNVTQEQYHTSTPTLKYTHTQAFDELSRIIESVGAASQTAEFAWDKNSNLTITTDPNTNDTTRAFDPLNRLVSSTDALSGVTALSYNDRNDLTEVEDQRSNATTYTYNAFGDVVGESSPDRGSISYTLDKAGNITQRTDARSVVTNYTYDALNRLTDVEYPSDGSLDAELSYDLSTGCGTAYKGKLCKIEDSVGTTEYEYDTLGRVTDVTETRGGLTFTTGYTYDLAGNILTITLDSGRVITYTRNSNGQVSGVSAVVNSSGTTLASSITYLPFGPMDAMTYGNSLTFSATYDQDYYLTNRTVSGSIYNHTYDTDANGNITQVGGTDYAYDELNRLEQEDDGSTIDYTFDATSNRLTRVEGGTVTTTVPSSSNKISAVGGDSYTYDSAGNITDDDTYEYTWDAANRLEEIELSGTSTNVGSYTYNANNQRATKTVSSTTTHYVYGMGGLLYGEYDSSGNLIREYVYLNGEPLAQIDSGETLTYIHTDHLGTPKFATNTGGTQVWSWAPDAFGIGSPSGSVTINLRMAGQYFDSESGLFYNWNRYYNPNIGRYITSDPIGLAGGLNTYNYANVSPLMFVDPEGLAEMMLTKRTLAALTADLSVPEPTDMTPIKWAGWGVAVTGAAVVDMCILNNDSADGNSNAKASPSAGPASNAGGTEPSCQEEPELPGCGEDNNKIDSNKLNHIFGNARHKLDPVVMEHGSQANAYRAIKKATQQAIEKRGISKGVFTEKVLVGSNTVTVRGVVINGQARIGSAWIP